MNSYISTHYKNGMFLNVSSEFTKITGYSEDEIRLTNTYSIIHPDDRANVYVNSHIRTEFEVPKVYFRLRKKSGEYIWCKAYSTVVGDQIIAIVHQISSSNILSIKYIKFLLTIKKFLISILYDYKIK